ncbi:MAG: hypothetical protein P8130_01505 [Deltaproteobacteria bacterium]
MQLTDPNLHLKLQEMCECYLETDFTKQLNAMVKGSSKDLEEDAVKYLALAIMHGVSDRARTLKLKKKKDGTIKIGLTIDGEKISLPVPSPELFDRIVGVIRSILHFEEGSGSMPLALGLRNSNIELMVKLKEKEGDTSLKLSYPEE